MMEGNHKHLLIKTRHFNWYGK